MAGSLPSVPNNFLVQTGNGTVYLNWSQSVGSSGYYILRSTDQINYTQIAATSSLQYYDTTASTGILYAYEVQAWNGNGTSNATSPQVVTPVNYGQVSLGAIRLAAQQRADMINNNFVTTQEWNSYISKSYTELYDMLVEVYADEYYLASPYQFITDGRSPALYPLPVDFYKLLGVDLGISSSNNAWLTLRKFPFAKRNQYLYGNTTVNFLGYLNLQYRLMGNNIEFVPYPIANQVIQLWYIPRPKVLMADSDILDGISGWDEYVVIDAAIKAMQKEESDITVLAAQKMAMEQRIRAAASNRDAGMPEQVTDVMNGISGYGNMMSDQPFGGY